MPWWVWLPCHTMTEKYVAVRPAKAGCYHTTDDPEQCRTIKQKDGEVREVSDAAVEWHELEECQHCSGEFVNGRLKEAPAND